MQLTYLEEIDDRAWDAAVAPYPTAYFYHRSGWIRFLEETQSASPVRFRIEDGDGSAGFFAGLLVKKGPLTILGSPLSGWLTEYMGPVATPEFDFPRFLVTVDEWCRRRRVHQIEIGSPLLDEDVMRSAGYDVLEWSTFRIPLATDEARMWDSLGGKARNRIRKGLSNGLTVEDSNDPGFADEHFDMLLDVYAKQNRVPPFSAEYFRALRRHLKPDGLLYCLRVKQGGRTVASGFFPHDERRVYSLSTSSRREDQPLCPNELLHWKLMTLAGGAGIEEYSLGDNYRVPDQGGRFKDKFHGTPMTVRRYVKSYSLLAKYGRGAYRTMVNAKRTLRDGLRRTRGGDAL